VTSLPLAALSAPRGIVIRSGAPAPKPVRFWAYLWATDDEDTVDQHWHQRVPSEHAAETRTAVRALGETPPDFGSGVFVFSVTSRQSPTPCTASISRLNSN
jgi:hypothetical protein